MTIFLLNKETNEILKTYNNVIVWDETFVEYENSGYRSRIYCEYNEFFTDKRIEEN